MIWRSIKHMYQVFCDPKGFSRAAAADLIADVQRHGEGTLTDKERAKWEGIARRRTQHMRGRVASGVGVTLLTIGVGVTAGVSLRAIFGPLAQPWVSVLQAAGAGVVLGATLGQVHRKDESVGGSALTDNMNAFIFQTLYVIGTFTVVLSLAWG